MKKPVTGGMAAGARVATKTRWVQNTHGGIFRVPNEYVRVAA